MPLDFEQWLDTHRDRILLRVTSGSHAYGLANQDSDVDERGLFVIPAVDWLSLREPDQHVQDERGDIVYFGLRKFVSLAAAANPGALELLHAPADTIRFSHAAVGPLLAARSLFVTQRCIDSHISYARTQVQRARGQNKWVHNAQPQAPPRGEDHCHVILGPWPGSAAGANAPLRPRPLADAGVDLREYHCAALEHVPRTFRLYHYGPSARGVFRGGQLVCESIPIEHEAERIRGLLIYDDDGYQRARRDHTHYWQWRRLRNEARWRTQESGEIDYDQKNMMHTFRLLMSAEAILRTGAPRVRFDGADRAELLRIRAGVLSHDDLVQRADAMVRDLLALRATSGLPVEPDLDAVDALLREVTQRWSETRA